MRAAGDGGSIVTILCDGGERYTHSYYNPDWYRRHGIEIEGADAALARALDGHALDVAVAEADGGAWPHPLSPVTACGRC